MSEIKKNEGKHQVRGTLTFNDDESYSAYLNGDANFNNGLRNRDKRTMYRQPDFKEDIENNENTEYIEVEIYEKIDLTPEQQESAQILGTVLAVGITLLATEFFAPNVAKWWKKSAAPILKDKWNVIIGKKQSEKKGAKSKATIKKSEMETSAFISNVFYQELDVAYENYSTDMTNEEVQRELLDIFILSAIIYAKVKRLSNANVVYDQIMISQLTTPKYISGINRILQSNPTLLKEKSALLSEILGKSLILNGIFVPIKNKQLKERLLDLKNNNQ